MGSIGNTATRKDSTLCTYFDARRKLDAMFIQCRSENLDRQLQPEDEYVLERACFLRHHAACWRRATIALRNALLPQRKGKTTYRRVRTVNGSSGGREKVRPRNSLKLQLARRLKRRARKGVPGRVSHTSGAKGIAGRTGRSHHPFNPATGKGYVTTRGRGRPPVSEERKVEKLYARTKKRTRKRREKTEKERAAAGKKIYVRRTPGQRKAQAAYHKRRFAALVAARHKWHALNQSKFEANGSRFKDERKNHHREMAYRGPVVRQRGNRRHYHRTHRSLLQKGAVVVLMLARKFHKNATRRMHLRGYWEQVKHLRESRKLRGRP